MLKTQIKSTPAYKKQLGMTFIEVLVAFVIIVTGILGAVAMQATAKQASFDAMQRSLASGLAQDIIARMRANTSANIASYALVDGDSDYGDGFDPTVNIPTRCDAPNNLCTSVQLAANDLYEWQLALTGADVTDADDNRTGGLVNGRGCIFEDNNAITVVVSWDGRNNGLLDGAKNIDCGGTLGSRRQVVVQAFIL